MTTHIDRAADHILTGIIFNANEPYAGPVAKKIAEALHAAGLLKDDLPEPDGDPWASVTDDGRIYICCAVDDTYLTPTEARCLARDLLTAAEEADRDHT